MSDVGILLLLYAVAVAMLTAEIFIPSHGVLTIVGIGFLAVAIVRTFAFGETAGTLSIVGSVIALPTFAVVAVKVWPNTRLGRMIVPRNPTYTREELAATVTSIEPLVGRSGRTLSPLRPVGTCEFDGRRLECVSESGMIDAGVEVRAVGIRGRNLEVAVAHSDSSGE